MKVLVTGSAGFIGSHVVKALQARGDRVTLVDKKTGGDLTIRRHYWISLAAGHGAIIHLAGTCSTPGSVANPSATFDDTVLSAVNILEAARVNKIPIVVTSSVKARDGRTPYGAAKRMVETWAMEYRAAYHLPVIINRPGTVYGPGQEGSEESGWIAWFLEAQRHNRTITINGDGEQRRDLLHVSDYVRLLLRQIDNVSTYDTGVFWDVGGGVENAVTVNEMAEHLGLTVVHGPERYGDSRSYIGENLAPGWVPLIDWKTSGTLGV